MTFMSQPVISVENLSKAYWLGQKEKTHDTLTGAVKSLALAPLRNLRRLRRLDTFSGNEKDQAVPEDDVLWALQDVSFEVAEGEVVGIIGRNGAGKSTLLKILSRITEPTSGQAVIRGRVSSLLEVGTGFHPELSGRDNVYMNGTILGMTKREIDRKFDEIVDFSGVERFLDTPVKRYSSGMQVRLAFAVAAHLEPEILIIDEVLAVGDGEFQKKCLGKMQHVAGQGRTVLFVSHNMGMITSLCQTGLLMESGGVSARRTASETVLAYSCSGRSSPHFADFTASGRPIGDHLATLLEARIEDMQGNCVSEVDIRNPFKVKMQYQLHQSVPRPPLPNFHFLDDRGEYAFVSSGSDPSPSVGQPGTYEAECIVAGHLLNNGTFFIGVALTFTHQGIHVSFYEKDALSVSVRDPIDETLDDMRSGYSGDIPGPVRPNLDWHIQRLPQSDRETG